MEFIYLLVRVSPYPDGNLRASSMNEKITAILHIFVIQMKDNQLYRGQTIRYHCRTKCLGAYCLHQGRIKLGKPVQECFKELKSILLVDLWCRLSWGCRWQHARPHWAWAT
jgi:hypothetical protein